MSRHGEGEEFHDVALGAVFSGGVTSIDEFTYHQVVVCLLHLHIML